jgi:hypothetical protein
MTALDLQWAERLSFSPWPRLSFTSSFQRYLEGDMDDFVKRPFNCCLNTPEPGEWRAGVDDSASEEMVETMNGIRDNLSYRTPILDFIKQLQAAVQIDNRTLLGRDIQRCLLSNAAHRLTLLAEKIDPAPWRTPRDRIKDAWAVFKGRAVAIHIRGTVYDKDWRL